MLNCSELLQHCIEPLLQLLWLIDHLNIRQQPHRELLIDLYMLIIMFFLSYFTMINRSIDLPHLNNFPLKLDQLILNLILHHLQIHNNTLN